MPRAGVGTGEGASGHDHRSWSGAVKTTGVRREAPGAEMSPAADSRQGDPEGRNRRGRQGVPAPSLSWPRWGSWWTTAGREGWGPEGGCSWSGGGGLGVQALC